MSHTRKSPTNVFMENRFMDMDVALRQTSRVKSNGGNGHASSGMAIPFTYAWARPFTAQDRALVILIENGGVDLGIPALVDKLWALILGHL